VGGLTLLRDARRAGLIVSAQGEQLVIRGPRSLEALAQSLLAAKPAVLLALTEEQEIAWRVEAMRPQVPATGAIPLLLARPGRRFERGTCCSCGDHLAAVDRYRCSPCASAVVAVLETPASDQPPIELRNET
jgi:hypothetical protein